MKRRRIVGLILACLLGFFSFSSFAESHPQTIHVEGQTPDGWLYHYVDGHTSEGYYYNIIGTNELLFCVEPHADRVGGPRTEYASLAQYFGNDTEFANRLSLIAYYGMNSGWGIDGYAAAQSLIWKYVMQRNGENGEQYVTTPSFPTREALQNYYNVIEQQINSYLTKPSFSEEIITLKAGQSITVTDLNGVLSSMDISRSSGPIQMSKNGNQLTITAAEGSEGNGKIEMRKLLSSTIEGQNFVYTSSSLQDVMTCGYYDPFRVILNINIIPSTVDYKFSKKDITNEEELPGAALQVTDEAGQVVDRWISGNTPHMIQGLRIGASYTMSEVSPAPGYTTAESIIFTVGENPQIITMTDRPASILVSKKDMVTGEELPGAALQVTDASGEVVDEWISNGRGHKIEKLTVGQTYILKEIKPAPGYTTAREVPFTVKDTDEIQTVTMKDDITKVEIRKVDITTGEELPGAALQVTDASGEMVDEWISDGTGHKIEKLTVGQTYILKEIEPAPGYTTAREIAFTVADTGEVQKVEMQDDITQIEVSKLDTDTKNMLAGAELQILDKDGTVVEEWVSGMEPYIIKKLIVGETYTLHEKNAPDGYLTASDVSFTVEDTGEIQAVVMEDKLAVIKLEVTKETIRKVKPGDTYKYTVTSMKNISNTSLDNFIMTDCLPNQVIIKELHTGVFSHKLIYKIAYQTSRSEEWHVFAEGLDTFTDQTISFENIPLEEDEQVTAFRYEFGTVPEGFSIKGTEPVYAVTVKDTVEGDRQLINDIKVTGDWRGITYEKADQTKTQLSSGGDLEYVFTGDGAVIICFVTDLIVSAGVIIGLFFKKRQEKA